MSESNHKLRCDLMEAYKQLEYLWVTTHSCPCGARPESPQSHPHVIGCPTEKAVRMFAAMNESEAPDGV